MDELPPKCRCCGEALVKPSEHGGTYFDSSHEVDCYATKLDRRTKALEQFADDKNWDWGNTFCLDRGIAREALKG